MPPMSKTKRLPFKPPRQVAATGGESSGSASGPASKTTSKKRRPTTEDDPSPSTSSGNRSKRRDVRNSPSPSLSPSPDPPPEAVSRSPSGSASSENPQSLSPEPDYILAEITTAGNDDEDIMTSEPKIPSKLVTALLHHQFQDSKTRITKDATKVYAKYLEIFVREAVARAVYERKETLDTDLVGKNRIQTMLDSYLEVEDLEKLVPQLLMDF